MMNIYIFQGVLSSCIHIPSLIDRPAGHDEVVALIELANLFATRLTRLSIKIKFISG